MSKKLIVAAAIACQFFQLAQAEVNLDMRADYDSLNWSHSTLPDSARFLVPAARVEIKGNLNEQVSYRFRYRFDRALNDTTYRDSLGTAVEFAAITHKMSDELSLTLGKFNSEGGGIEQAFVPASDLYFKSQAYRDMSTQGGRNYFLFVTGAKLSYTIQNQIISLVYADLPAVDSTTNGAAATPANFDQKSGLVGLVYRGNFAEKTILPLVSYYTFAPPNSALSERPKNTYYDASLKFDQPTWYVFADYNNYVYENQTVAGKDDSTNSAVAEIGYKKDQYTMRLKLENSNTEVFAGAGGSVKTNYTGYGAILEWMPTKDNFRYHVGYINRTTNASNGAHKDLPTEQHIIVGMKLFAALP